MIKSNSKWVVGHKVSFHDTSGDYDLTIIETPPQVQGPPPHTHKLYKESFIIIDGEMEFFVNGTIKTLKAGEVLDIPANTLHTFENKGDKTCRFVNIHSPKGFRDFFVEMGISDDESDAQMKSVSPEVIENVIQSAENFDMHIKM
ncbi:MAG: cupin domain-containing protein [Algibacter sp.]|uniref:cupin domain-containing protein n=1 Tax=Algibacter sp. TaxID=1872428 RepID=UPI00329A7429